MTHSTSGLSFSNTSPKSSVGAAGRGGELADDAAALDLDGRDEQRRRQVDDDRVDLVGLECRLGADVVVVHERLGVGLDDVGDEVEARRARLGAELDVLQVGDRGGAFGRRVARPTIAWLLE